MSSTTNNSTCNSNSNSNSNRNSNSSNNNRASTSSNSAAVLMKKEIENFDLKSKLEKSEIEKTKLATQNEVNQLALVATAKKKSKLEEEIQEIMKAADIPSTISSPKVSKREHEKEIKNLNDKVDDLDVTIDDLSQELTHKDEDYDVLEEKLIEATTELEEVKSGKEAVEKELDEVKLGKEAVEKELDEVKLGTEAVEKELAEVKLGKEAVEKELDEVKLGKEAFQKELVECKEREIVLADTLQTTQDELNGTKEELEVVKSEKEVELNECKEREMSLAGTLQTTQDELNVTKEELEAAKSEKKAVEKELQAKDQQIVSLEDKSKKTKKQPSGSGAKFLIEDAKHEMRKATDRSNQLQGENDGLHNNLKTCKKELKKSEADNRKLLKFCNKTGEVLVGRAIIKVFDGTEFKGRVTAFDPETLFFRIVYDEDEDEDEDSEDLEIDDFDKVRIIG